MFCKRCGANLRDTAQFCPKCGSPTGNRNGNRKNPVPPPIPPKQKKSHIWVIFLILALLLVLAAGAGGWYLWNNSGSHGTNSKKTDEKSEDNSAQFSRVESVNTDLQEWIASEEFQSADAETKKQQAEEMLSSLEEQEVLEKDSVSYDETSNMYWFVYADGTQGGVMLDEFSDDVSGSKNAYATTDSAGKVTNRNNKISWNNTDYPYEEENLHALFLYGLDQQGVANSFLQGNYQQYQSVWTEEHLDTSIDEFCTVEDFQTELPGNDVIILEEHGSFQKDTPMVCTKEVCNSQNYQAYQDDLQDHSISVVTVYGDNSGNTYYWIAPSFFPKHYANQELSGSIVWIGSCHGYQNDKLVKAFADAGAAAVLGHTNTVYTAYDADMLDAFMYRLLQGDTVGTALDFAKSVWGVDDITYATVQTGWTSVKPAEENASTEIYCGKDETLVTLTQAQGEAYTWHLEPSIDADFVGVVKQGHPVSRVYDAEYYQYDTNWYSPYCCYGENGRFGLIDYDGNLVTDAVYSEIRIGWERKCILQDENYLCQELLPDGTLSSPVSAEEYQEVTNGYPVAIWVDQDEKLYTVESGYPNELDLHTCVKAYLGEWKMQGDYRFVTSRYAQYVLINNGKRVTSDVYEDMGCMVDGIIPVKKNGKWGYLNENGEEVFPFEYDDAWESNRTAYIINYDNTHYADYRAFDASDGYVVLCQNGQYGLYRTTGECVIPFGTLEEISPVYEGMAWAKQDGKWGVIALS